MKWTYFVMKWKPLFSNLFFPGKLCRVNVTGPRAIVLKDGLCNTVKVLKFFFVGGVSSLCFLGAVPVYFFVFKNIMMPMIPLELPYVDQVMVIPL